MTGMEEMRKLDSGAKKVPQKYWFEQWFAIATNSSALRRNISRTCCLNIVLEPRNRVSQDLPQNATLFTLKQCSKCKKTQHPRELACKNISKSIDLRNGS